MSPEESVLSWLHETIDHEIWVGDYAAGFTASKVVQFTELDSLEITTTLGVFRLKIERKS